MSNQKNIIQSTLSQQNTINHNFNTINTSLANSSVKNTNNNLFFLQKTLLPLNNITHSASHFNDVVTSNNTSSTVLNLNTSFLQKIHFTVLTKSSSNLQTLSNHSSLLNEADYVLSTKLNPSFNKTLTFSSTLNDLFKNEANVTHDPVLSETITTNLNNISKQQR
jgi:hypothetical protein